MNMKNDDDDLFEDKKDEYDLQKIYVEFVKSLKNLIVEALYDKIDQFVHDFNMTNNGIAPEILVDVNDMDLSKLNRDLYVELTDDDGINDIAIEAANKITDKVRDEFEN